MKRRNARAIKSALFLAGIVAVVAGAAMLLVTTYYSESASDHYAYSAGNQSPLFGGGGGDIDGGMITVAPRDFDTAGGHDPPPGYLEGRP